MLLRATAFITGLLALLSVESVSAKNGAYWDYDGVEGSAYWHSLTPAFSACALGMEQSPIDIQKNTVLSASDLKFSYHTTPLNIIDNGHSLKINVAPGNHVTLDGREYQLLQFHYHSPSEHTIDGKHYPLAMHFVHQNTQGEYLVVGVLVKEGAANPEQAKIVAAKPDREGAAIQVKGVVIDLPKLQPVKQQYYQYAGSFTTPPCTEGVTWIVMKEPVTVSKSQLAVLSSVHPGNHRPIQPLNDRADGAE